MICAVCGACFWRSAAYGPKTKARLARATRLKKHYKSSSRNTPVLGVLHPSGTRPVPHFWCPDRPFFLWVLAANVVKFASPVEKYRFCEPSHLTESADEGSI